MDIATKARRETGKRKEFCSLISIEMLVKKIGKLTLSGKRALTTWVCSWIEGLAGGERGKFEAALCSSGLGKCP